MSSFAIEILTPEKRVFAGEAQSLILPGWEGFFGVLAGHVPLLARLAAGRVMVRQGSSELHFHCGAGVADVNSKRVTILVDSAEAAKAPKT